MKKAVFETKRRQKIQKAYNKQHNIVPATIQKTINAFDYSAQDVDQILEGSVNEDILNYKAEELNPRQVLIINTKEKTIKNHYRGFYDNKPEHDLDKQEIISTLMNKLEQALLKRIPEHHVGILFSGGIDSTILAWICKKHKIPFTCYTSAWDTQPIAEDLRFARQVAEELDFPLKETVITQEEIGKTLPKLVPLIESSNVVKVGVALPFYFCARQAAKDGIKVMLSGLGSEELFAGYERHSKASDINNECISGLRKLYERDLYRDDVVLMDQTIELRLPFLDDELIAFSVKIPAEHKISKTQKKIILRDAAKAWGIPEKYSNRPKRAAQYGSRFDKALEKLAKVSSSKSTYLRTFYDRPNLKLGVLFSTGKDSNYAAYIMQRQNYELACLITIASKNPDSYMYHTPAIEHTKTQAEAMNKPLLIINTSGEKETELIELKEALEQAKQKYQLDGVITGAIYSTYQRDRIERICDEVGLKVFSPLWHKSQEEEMRQLITEGFKFIFTKVAADGLDKTWLGKVITLEDVDKLQQLNEKIGLNVAGEGGEFESFVVDCPLYNKSITITKSHIKEEAIHTAEFFIEELKLHEKSRNI